MKMKNPSHIDRRMFLKGAGVTLALPFMDSLALAAREATSLFSYLRIVAFW